MQQISVDLLTDQGNNAVLRLPGRTYPGVLVQGDTLTILLQNLEEVKASLLAKNTDDAVEAIDGIIEDIVDIKARYDKACVDNPS